MRNVSSVRPDNVFKCLCALCLVYFTFERSLKPLDGISQQQAEFLRHQYLLKCLRHVLENELPMSRRDVQELNVSLSVAFAHHWDAGRAELWNEEIRLSPVEEVKGSNCTIWEVGANVNASDSRRFMSIYPGCDFHAYEPVPTFATQLEDNWRKDPSSHQLNIHHYGLGSQTRSFSMREEDVRGESAFIDESDSGNIQIQIKNFAQAVREAKGIPSLISINCEGCEWALINEGLDDGFFQKVPIIQIGWHNYGEELGKRAVQLCEIRERLSISHDFVDGVAFGWERWKKKKEEKKNVTALHYWVSL